MSQNRPIFFTLLLAIIRVASAGTLNIPLAPADLNSSSEETAFPISNILESANYDDPGNVQTRAPGEWIRIALPASHQEVSFIWLFGDLD